MTVQGIRVSMVDQDTHRVTDLWAVEGSIYLDAGSIVVLGEELPGAETTTPPGKPVLAGHYVDIHLDSTNSRGGERVYFGHFDGDRLSSDQWLRNDGGIAADPC
jgi:hypothetical protein